MDPEDSPKVKDLRIRLAKEVKLYWANHDQYYIKTSEFDLIYVNGTNNLENLRPPTTPGRCA